MGLSDWISTQVGTKIWYVAAEPSPHRNHDFELHLTPEQHANFRERFERLYNPNPRGLKNVEDAFPQSP
jgi:hypothetical protein